MMQYLKLLMSLDAKQIVMKLGYGYSLDQECFWVIKPFDQKPATRGNGSQMIIT